MAVDRLSKLSILAEKEQEDRILQLLQESQKIEIEDILQADENQPWLKKYFPDRAAKDDQAEKKYQELQQQIQTAISFIMNHGSVRDKAKRLPRKNYDLVTLENEFNEKKLRSVLTENKKLTDKWENIQQQLERWETVSSWADDWKNFDLAADEDSLYTTYLLGRAPDKEWENIQLFCQQKKIYLEILDSQKQETLFACLFLKKEASEIKEYLSHEGVIFEKNPYESSPKQLAAWADRQLQEWYQQEKKVAQKIGQLKKKVAFLQKSEEILLAKLQREKVKATLAHSNYIVVIRGWVATADIAELKEDLVAELAENALYFSLEDPSKEAITQKKVPTKLKNKKWIQPFESLTSMYALPKYEEIDPTPWMAPFYFVFFGMMVADLGYGLILLLGTTAGLKFFGLKPSFQSFFKLFQILSLSVIFWGIIYGTAFGVELPFQQLNPTEDFMTIFMISLVFGGLQLFTGLFLAAKENLKRKDYLSAVREGFSWQGILAGILIAALGTMILHSDLLKNIGIILAVINALFIVIIPAIQSRSRIGGFFSGLYDLYGITGYIGDFVSYSRLMALGISGGSIAMAFNLLVGTLPTVARFTIGIVLIVALQGLNLFLSVLSAYVHAARLQYVEYFGKFYQGGGRAFRPFKTAEKYLNITNKRRKVK